MKMVLLIAAGLLLLWVLWPQSERRERVTVEKGVALAENRKPHPRTETLWGTPLTPSWKKLLLRIRQDGWKGRTNGPLSGLRTHKGQKKLWTCFRRGVCPPAFHPRGPSRHLHRNVRGWGQWSLAVDVSRPEGLVQRARRMGVPLWVPYDSEPWHIEALSVWSLPDKTVLQRSPSPKPLWPLLLAAPVLLWGFWRERDWIGAQIRRFRQ